MTIDRKELEQKLQKVLKTDRKYQKVQSIVERNADNGKIWLIGGYVYRNLISLVHNTNNHKPHKDYDFLIESPNNDISLPFGWICRKNIFGDPKFCRIWDRATVDFVPLQSFRGLDDRPEKDIEYYLNGVPFDIQSIAYDLSAGTLEGEKWVKSLENKTIRIVNREKFDEAVKVRKGQTPENYIKKTADSLGFSYSLL